MNILYLEPLLKMLKVPKVSAPIMSKNIKFDDEDEDTREEYESEMNIHKEVILNNPLKKERS